MFFIIDIIPGMKELKEWNKLCIRCKQIGNIKLIKVYQCLRLFFIPILKWKTRYYLTHSCGMQIELTEEDALAILYAGVPLENILEKIDIDTVQYSSKCRNCQRELEPEYICCPYCGTRRE